VRYATNKHNQNSPEPRAIDINPGVHRRLNKVFAILASCVALLAEASGILRLLATEGGNYRLSRNVGD